MDLHEELKQLGWRQGSVLTDEDYVSLVSSFTATHANPVGIVLSHSCDVLNPVLKKFPKIEIIVGRFITSPDSRCQQRRNPRILHLPIQVEGVEKWIELRVENRTFVERDKFSGHKVDVDRHILERDRHDMSLWISGAYYRSALPDSFQMCLDPNRTDFDRIYGNLNRYISDILVSIHPNGELQSEQRYSATVTLIVENEADITVGEVIENREQLEETLKKSSIDAVVNILPESKATITLLRTSYRLTTDAWSDINRGHPVTALADVDKPTGRKTH